MACDKILGWIDDQILRDINIEKIKFPMNVNANAIFYIRITFLEKNCWGFVYPEKFQSLKSSLFGIVFD